MSALPPIAVIKPYRLERLLVAISGHCIPQKAVVRADRALWRGGENASSHHLLIRKPRRHGLSFDDCANRHGVMTISRDLYWRTNLMFSARACCNYRSHHLEKHEGYGSARGMLERHVPDSNVHPIYKEQGSDPAP
jgi:hypothetical protein